MAYKDYVVVKFNDPKKHTLCIAPGWSNLKPDDEVIADTGLRGTILSCETFEENEDALKIILPLANQDRIPKIKSKIDYVEFTYSNEVDSDE